VNQELQRVPRSNLPLVYIIGVEFIYLLYELSLQNSPESALVLGVVLAFFTFPTIILSGAIQPSVALLMGYAASDTHAFLPRFAAWQIPIFINFYVWILLTRPKNDAGPTQS
jgi:hypothetical protein